MRGEEKRNKYRILTGGAIEDESPAKSSFNPRISSVPCTQLDNSSWLRRHWPAILAISLEFPAIFTVRVKSYKE